MAFLGPAGAANTGGSLRVIGLPYPGTDVVVTVLTHSSAFIAQSVPTDMVAAGQYAVSIHVRNTGSSTWSPVQNSDWDLILFEITLSVARAASSCPVCWTW